MLYTLKNIVLMNATPPGADKVDQAGKALADIALLIQKYVAIAFGALSGLAVLVTIILAVYAFWKASKANTEQERQDEFKKVKLSGCFILVLLGAWAITASVLGIIQAIAASGLLPTN
ncbi:hypothetical protein NX779_03020 [Mycoplasma cottewii]|uniref:Transmembrane protein n=1 Tax=Mycoplasma cottewii TaxID=51364 RepID=A0ABY5TVU3_9MOLU|nr:hypothetical protein [Mycoplasma cottewii]UWD34762.1 hypothetical protein NX779_03020 [Mycoplasma cottewii]